LLDGSVFNQTTESPHQETQIIVKIILCSWWIGAVLEEGTLYQHRHLPT